MTAIFSLFSVFTATLAWFAASTSVTASGMSVIIKAEGGVSINEMKLIKFNYAKMSGAEDLYDYLQPKNGNVGSYTYVNDPAHNINSFGYYENNQWVKVSLMNAYDPVEKIIKGNSFDLSSMNCNAIYEVTFSAPSADYLLSISAKSNGVAVDRAKGEISMLECADIDVFYEEDLIKQTTTYQTGKSYPANSVTIYNGAVYYTSSAISAEGNASFDASSWTLVGNFDESKAYASGDHVFYEKAMYVCTAHTGDSAYNSEHWEAATVTPVAFSVSTAYTANTVVSYDTKYYQLKTAIEANEYESFEDIPDEDVEEITDFSSSSSYAVGDLIYRNSAFLSCKTAIGGAFVQEGYWNKYTNYVAGTSYVEDDVVVYDGILYSNKTPVSSGAFNEVYWTPLLFGDNYHPSYKTPTANTPEDLYYKISYLSSKKQSHKHFYFSEAFNSAHWEQVTTTPSAYATGTAYAVDDVVSYSNKYYQCISPMTTSSNTKFSSSKWREIKDYDSTLTYSFNNYVLSGGNLYKCKVDNINVNNSETVLVNKNQPNDSTPYKVYINVNYAPSQLEEYYEKIYSSNIKVYKAIFDFVFNFDFANAPQQVNGD